jgi:quercetin dioxygenase-like cupin family protein
MVTENQDRTSANTTAKAKMPAGEAFDITSMVNYAEGSIVSRTLIENKGGTITLFAFDAGQSLSEHTAPFDAFVQVLDGEGEFTVGGKTSCVTAGQGLLMPANIPHSLKALKRFKMLLTMLKLQ